MANITMGDLLLGLLYKAPDIESGMNMIIKLFGKETAVGLKNYMDSFGSFEVWQKHLKECEEIKSNKTN